MTDLQSLIAAADAAPPQERPSRRWSAMWPAVSRLRAKGYTYPQAITWLIEQGVMSEDDRLKAKHAFWQIAHRRLRNNNETNNDNQA